MAYLLEIVNKIIPVLMAGLFFGAGLPALYALGLRLIHRVPCTESLRQGVLRGRFR